MNIYEIENWNVNTVYSTNDIVRYASHYFYSLRDNNQGNAPSAASDFWGGVGMDGLQLKPYFIWKPSYATSFNSEPRIKTIQFGDGYSQDIEDGINNLLITVECNFENRGLAETRAILHFLEARKGAESFLFIPPPPRSKLKRFKCKRWQDRQIFYNNYSITANFEEVVI